MSGPTTNSPSNRPTYSDTGNIAVPLLIVVGLPCSGKTEFAKVAAAAGLYPVEWSSVIAQTLTQTVSKREASLAAAEEAVSIHGVDHLPKRIVAIIEQALNGPRVYPGVVVSGARNPHEIESLIEHFNTSRVVMIHATYQCRFQRCLLRQRPGDPTSLEQFVRSDLREYHTGLARIGADSGTLFLFNDRQLPQFHAQARSFLQSWLAGSSLAEVRGGQS